MYVVSSTPRLMDPYTIIDQLMGEFVDVGPQVVQHPAAELNHLATESVPVEKLNHPRHLPSQSDVPVEASISLPSEGNEPWEINQVLTKAIQRGQLTLHIKQNFCMFVQCMFRKHTQSAETVKDQIAKKLLNQEAYFKDKEIEKTEEKSREIESICSLGCCNP
ncbi:hypothetical protein DAPPUDRAFT_242810 [Daphnia pulex]|uniref:Uncharacterized protein n=1 Tax=Daphnia pulex TaxID=6669 RepID=E9GHF5_DAPPU|nr:hypothetical protein DAPPUDRAFT_242810 [Daphnia pulex]|eukprot:EFX81185.1 hypothetical protein DAPPUDRAFT_242810 [Daphnia pulex]